MEAGIHDVPELEYHADEALSVSGAKKLLDCPAKFHDERVNGRQPVPTAYDTGSVTHALVLHSGDNRIRVYDRYDWRGNAGKQRDAMQVQGLVPIHRGQLLEASTLARAVRRHPLASAIFSEGVPEQSICWVDEGTGVTCRGRIDWLRDNAVVDFKTAADASPDAFSKAAFNNGLYMQAAWYIDGIAALGGGERPFLFVVVEKQPPYLVAVYQLDEYALDLGREKNRQARELFAECTATGEWPGYSSEIETLSLPRWAA